MLIPKLTILVFFIVMNTSDMTMVKENLTVGGSITLPTPIMQDGALYLNNSIIAVVVERKSTITEKHFRDKLHWNNDSGLFTITTLQRNYSGIYKLEDKTTSVVTVIYQLTVYDPAPMPGVNVSDVSSESCSLVCFIQKDDETVLYWYKGEKVLNQTSTVPSLSLTVPIEGLNSSYSCVAANPANNNTLSLNITTLCSDNNLPHKNRYWWLGLVVPAVFISVALVVMTIRKRTRDRTPQDPSKREEPLYTEVNIVERTDKQERNSVGLSEIRPPSNLTTVYDTLSLRHMNETDAVACSQPSL